MHQQQVVVQQPLNEQPAAQQIVAEQAIIQQQQAILQQQQVPQQMLAATQNGSVESIPNDCQQRVDQLHLEVAKIRKRNNEIQQQLFSQSMVVNQKENDAAAINHHNANNLNTAGMDPFLSGENHSRQESADSGIDSGLGREYSLPNTPDDMLVLEDEFGLESLAITSMDLDENMEHDDMLPNGMETNYNATDILNMPDLDAILAGGTQMNCLE